MTYYVLARLDEYEPAINAFESIEAALVQYLWHESQGNNPILLEEYTVNKQVFVMADGPNGPATSLVFTADVDEIMLQTVTGPAPESSTPPAELDHIIKEEGNV